MNYETAQYIVNFKIMRVFTRIRNTLINSAGLRLIIEGIKKTDNNTQNIELVFQYLDQLLEKKENAKPMKRIGYKIPKRSKNLTYKLSYATNNRTTTHH